MPVWLIVLIILYLAIGAAQSIWYIHQRLNSCKNQKEELDFTDYFLAAMFVTGWGIQLFGLVCWLIPAGIMYIINKPHPVASVIKDLKKEYEEEQ